LNCEGHLENLQEVLNNQVIVAGSIFCVEEMLGSNMVYSIPIKARAKLNQVARPHPPSELDVLNQLHDRLIS
jgi:hypothetical protein